MNPKGAKEAGGVVADCACSFTDPEPLGSCSWCGQDIWLNLDRRAAFPGGVFHPGCDLQAARAFLGACGVAVATLDRTFAALWYLLASPPWPHPEAHENGETR